MLQGDKMSAMPLSLGTCEGTLLLLSGLKAKLSQGEGISKSMFLLCPTTYIVSTSLHCLALYRCLV